MVNLSEEERKQQIISMYYDKHLKGKEIANILTVTPAYVSQVIKTDCRYTLEKQTRKDKNKIKHNQETAEYMKKKREEQKRQEAIIKNQHIEASKELSYFTEISDLAFCKWNSSAYHIDSKGNKVLDRKLKTSLDISKKIYMNIKIPTQKYKKKYCYSI